MPTNEEPKKEAIKDQHAAAELKMKTDELKREDTEEIVGGCSQENAHGQQ